MARKKSVSIRSIAAQCGLSTATVSRALNGSSHVSEEVRRRVFETAEAAGYQKVTITPGGNLPNNRQYEDEPAYYQRTPALAVPGQTASEQI